jgi:hypothetical protein
MTKGWLEAVNEPPSASMSSRIKASPMPCSDAGLGVAAKIALSASVGTPKPRCTELRCRREGSTSLDEVELLTSYQGAMHT